MARPLRTIFMNTNPASEEAERIRRIREQHEREERLNETKVTRAPIRLSDILGAGFKLGVPTS